MIETIPHEYQRYETVGDYVTDDFGQSHIRISNMKNWRYEMLVAIHEMLEQRLCMEAGMAEQDITLFDLKYEQSRPEGDTTEPGDSKDAPYYTQHQLATRIEKFIAGELGVNWDVYEKVINSRITCQNKNNI